MMPDYMWQVILTGLFTLCGTLLGIIGSNWQAQQAANRARERDQRQRRWSLRDFTRDRRLQVRDDRCAQAEKFIESMTEDFHHLRTNTIRIASLYSQDVVPADLEDFAHWQKRIDRTIFQYGPVISAISTKQHDLIEPWKKMEQGWKDMSAHYQFAYNTRITNQMVISDQVELLKQVNDVYGSYNDALRDFIITIDKIKSSRMR